MMRTEAYVLGPAATNTYILDIDGEVLIIDPAGKEDKMMSLIGQRKVLAILLTHGHFDHIKAVDGLYRNCGCRVFIHPADEALARDRGGGDLFGISASISCPVEHLQEGKMQIGPFSFEVIATPGHTPGSVIFVFEDCIFTGDTLFRNSVGRTDLEGGNESVLRQSLRVFREFKRDYVIYPGHEEFTTLSEELLNNWFLR